MSDTLITASSSVTHLTPGVYQLYVALAGIRYRPYRMTPAERNEKYRERARRRYHRNKAKRERMLQYLDNLPDDERELWLR